MSSPISPTHVVAVYILSALGFMAWWISSAWLWLEKDEPLVAGIFFLVPILAAVYILW